MLTAAEFHDALKQAGVDFFTGVPDSQLKPFCDHLAALYAAEPSRHVIAANEGGAVGIAAGYHLSTRNIPLVYMQNSGLGNAVNPLTSLTDSAVYGIPLLLLVGWRGKPGVKDEPQHVKQGEITPDLLKLLGVETFILKSDTTLEELSDLLNTTFSTLWKTGKSTAILVEKDALQTSQKAPKPTNHPALSREQAISHLASLLGEDDFVVSTTGKASRELYEYRLAAGHGGDHDFLTVGSMGHASMIALGLAEHGHRRIWCFDGDGAALMHLGGLALIGARKPDNLIHVLLNNVAHESVGGMPTVADQIQFCQVALACGYATAVRAETQKEISDAIASISRIHGPHFIEIMVNLDVRSDLGRPKTTPRQNKEAFMTALQQKKG